jgi:ATP-dependent DNA helicase RecQ
MVLFVTDIAQLLHDRFGFSHFRGVQEAVVERAVAGQHTLAVMPTGSGKSLCYQLPRWRGTAPRS